MRKKCNILAICLFVTALAVYAFTYFLFHYIGPDGHIVLTYQDTPSKPFIVIFFGVWGVMFQFAGVLSLLVGKMFFPKGSVETMAQTKE